MHRRMSDAHEIYPSVICSKRRFDYDEVQEILDGKRDDPYAAKLARFDALAKRLLLAAVGPWRD